jgi:hypothetical protein
MPNNYSPAPEVEKIAGKLIHNFHGHLSSVRIEYVFIDKTPKSQGKAVWGSARLIGGLNSFLAGNVDTEAADTDEAPVDEGFFVIVIAKPIFDSLPDQHREALIDHQLCHCRAGLKKGKGESEAKTYLSLAGHDIEEHSEVIQRHGLWTEEAKKFAEVSAQYRLGLDVPVEAGK